MKSVATKIRISGVDWRKQFRWIWSGAWLIAVIAIYLYHQTAYYGFDFELFLALLMVPFIGKYQKDRTSNRYAWLGLGLAILLLSGQVSNTLLYVVCCCAVLFWVEQNLGRLSWLLPVLLFLVAPAIRYLQRILSFPLRIELSEQAATVLSILDETARAEGNIIWYMGTDYSVDAACAGLHLLISSWVVVLTWLAYWERREKKRINFHAVIFWIIVATVLAVGANFSRLLFLVLFDIPPSSYLHELTGVVALFFYVVLPSGVVIYFKQANRKKAANLAVESPHDEVINRRAFFTKAMQPINRVIFPVCFIIVIMVGSRYTQLENRMEKPRSEQVIDLPGFAMTIMKDGVQRYTNDHTLIYVKPPVYGWQSAHDPRICWLGEGYQFDQIRKVQLEGVQMMIGRISKDSEQLYTAWWYDTGAVKTVDEWSWRWGSLLRGSPATLYNVSCENEKQLYAAIKIIVQP